MYKAEGFHGDQLQIDIALNDLTMYGCDIYYLISNKKTAVEIAHAKTGVVFFDYKERQIRAVPEPFKNKVFKDV